MGDSRRSPGFYGARVESWVLDHYDLERNYDEIHGARMDAEVPENGQPVEIKAVARNRRGGRADQSRFKIWRDQHAALAKANGYYVFVVYQLQADGIRVTNSRSVRAGSLNIDWYGETQPRGTEQAELPASELF
ncbi:hypothetical protein [Halovenus salina]|nr:hypothetical protein [Halovenus salina]